MDLTVQKIKTTILPIYKIQKPGLTTLIYHKLFLKFQKDVSHESYISSIPTPSNAPKVSIFMNPPFGGHAGK